MNPSKGRPEKPVGSLTPRFFSKGTPAASAHLARVLRPAAAHPPDGGRRTVFTHFLGQRLIDDLADGSNHERGIAGSGRIAGSEGESQGRRIAGSRNRGVEIAGSEPFRGNRVAESRGQSGIAGSAKWNRGVGAFLRSIFARSEESVRRRASESRRAWGHEESVGSRRAWVKSVGSEHFRAEEARGSGQSPGSEITGLERFR